MLVRKIHPIIEQSVWWYGYKFCIKFSSFWSLFATFLVWYCFKLHDSTSSCCFAIQWQVEKVIVWFSSSVFELQGEKTKTSICNWVNFWNFRESIWAWKLWNQCSSFSFELICWLLAIDCVSSPGAWGWIIFVVWFGLVWLSQSNRFALFRSSFADLYVQFQIILIN